MKRERECEKCNERFGPNRCWIQDLRTTLFYHPECLPPSGADLPLQLQGKLLAEIELLKAQGRMPSLAEVKSAVDETRKKYACRIVEARRVHNEGDKRPHDPTTAHLLKHSLPLTQRNWIELNFMGGKHSLADLEDEEKAELPDAFENWPEN